MKKILNLFKTLLLALPVVVLLVILGAGCVQDAVVPCWVEEGAIEYSGQEPTILMPYTTIADAERIESWMNYVHANTQIGYARLQEDDINKINFLQERALLHKTQAEEIKSIVFDPESPVAGLIYAALGTTIGATLIPRKREKDLEKEVAVLKNGNS